MITHRIPMDNKQGVKGVRREDLMTTAIQERVEKGDEEFWLDREFTAHVFTEKYWELTIDGPEGAFLTIESKAGQSRLYATLESVPEGDVAGFIEWADGIRP
jgi:hypothetical protein